MIISNLIGGLGNQMFQYAAGRALSLSKGLDFRLDVSDFDNYKLHQGFEIQRVFGCPVQLADFEEVQSLLGWQSSSTIRRIVARPELSVFRRPAFVVEPHFHFWDGINNVNGNAYLFGYWQTERYFRRYSDVIRSDFVFRNSFDGINYRLAEKVSNVASVSLHVRRGDYINNPKTTANHGVCSLDYYLSAINYVAERVENMEIFIFSDDPLWVRQNISVDLKTHYVGHNQGADSYNDMRLMSLCKHHIIANSSFSWWGAWLNPDPNKIIVAPRRWFANSNDLSDLFPDTWVTL